MHTRSVYLLPVVYIPGEDTRRDTKRDTLDGDTPDGMSGGRHLATTLHSMLIPGFDQDPHLRIWHFVMSDVMKYII